MNDTFQEIRKFTCPELIFGIDSRKMTGKKVRKFGVDKVLLVSTPTIVSQPWFKDIVQSLHSAGVKFAMFTNISRIPTDSQVMEGSVAYHQEHCKCIVAVGGGGVIDCAKSIGVIVSNNNHITHFTGIDTIHTPMPPLICVPTTTGLASDVSQYTLITDSMKPRWSTIVSKLLVPDVSINDPFTLLTLGKETCIDNALVTLNLAIEAYVSNMSSPLTDTYALDAIEFLGKNITTVINKQEDIEIKGWLMMAGLKAGLAYSNAGLGINHSMAQALSAHGDASYGTCATIVAPHTIAYNHASSPTRYENIARHITSTVTPQHNPVDTLVSFMKTLQETAGITISRVSQRPIPHPSVLADTAIQHPSNATNPRVPTTTDIEALFTKALES